MSIIGIDFDGTAVTHDYPDIGSDIGATLVLKELVSNGHQLILWTMRSDDSLADAVLWFARNELPLFGVNENPQQKEWTKSPKAYAHYYIDDAALGTPLIYNLEISNRPFVDWKLMRSILVANGLIS